MKQEIKCYAVRTWLGWEGKITTPNGKTFRSGIIRYTKTEALMDAKQMKEELEKGQR